MDNYAGLMFVNALFIVGITGGIAGVVVATVAVIKRLERRSLHSLTVRLARGEITSDQYSELVAQELASALASARSEIEDAR